MAQCSSLGRLAQKDRCEADRRTHRHARGVLDTSRVLLLTRVEEAGSLPAEPLITAITLAELSVGPLVAADEAEREARQAHLQQAEAAFDPLPFDAAAARAFGRVAASLRRSGRKPPREPTTR